MWSRVNNSEQATIYRELNVTNHRDKNTSIQKPLTKMFFFKQRNVSYTYFDK